MARILSWIGALSGGAVTSQFPEFSQQYRQRLGGAVDELARVVAGFDADAADLGLSRSQALVELAQSGAIGAARAETMAETLTRMARLQADQAALAGLDAVQRVFNLRHFSDPELLQAVWASYAPAVPLTPGGAGFALAGLLAGLFAVSALGALARLLVRRG